MTQATYRYRAVDRSGAAQRGHVAAADRADALRQISASGLRPLKLSTGRRGRRRRISRRELSHFTRQFATLLQARIPIAEGIRSIAEQETNPALARVLDEAARQIECGRSVTESFEPHQAVFGEVYVETIRAAEKSGNMILVLGRLADMLECQDERARTLRGALLYPICIIGALSLAVLVLMIAVVPRFAAMFEARGLELPIPTQILIAISHALTNYWYLVAIGAASLVWLLRTFGGRREVRERFDNALHRVPYLRDILRGLAISRFANVLGTCLQSGLSLIDSLEMSGNASGRPLLQRDAEKLLLQVNQGGRLSDILKACTYLPAFTRRMISAGEEAAELPRMCDVIARHYDREVEHLTKNISTVIEPVMIVVLAAVVLGIAMAIFLPMWSMASLIS
jgi:type IV pilus assembly protein PilC